MTFVLQTSHPAGSAAFNSEYYWYGFIIHHLVLGSDGKTQPKVVAKEIAQLGLAMKEESRRSGGFFWPLDLYLKSRDNQVTFKQIAHDLYVGLEDSKVAFSEYPLCLRVDLLVARKGGSKLFDNGMVADVTVLCDKEEKRWPIAQEYVLDAAVYRTIFQAQKPGLPLEHVIGGAWSGVNSFDGGIEQFILEQENGAKNAIKAKEDSARDETAAIKIETDKVLTTRDSAAISAAEVGRAPQAATAVSTKDLSSGVGVTVPTKPEPAPDRSKFIAIAAASVVGIVGVIAYTQQNRVDPLPVAVSPSSTTAVAAAPVPATAQQSTPVSPPEPAKSAAVEPSPPPVDQARPDQIFIPQGNSVVTRDKLYSLNFEPQLALVKRMLNAAREKNATDFDSASEELKGFRQQNDWPKGDAVARRKFNEHIEALVNSAKTANDQVRLQSAISLSEQFLLTHFGHSTAHLNLSIAQAAAGNAKSALAPAFHTIVYNSEGANGWVALGVALARSGDISGATNAFCAVLRKVNYSERTVNYFGKVSRGEDLAYPEVTKAMSDVSAVCPQAAWAR